MRDFSMVSPRIWASPRFRGLTDEAAKMAMLYLLTNSHQSSIGCYRLPAGYACDDLDWEKEKFGSALKALVTADLIAADYRTEEILILRWFRHCPPTNAKHAQGTFRLVEKIESATLKEACTADLQAAWDKWQSEHPGSGAAAGQSRHLLDTPRMRTVKGLG